MVIYYLNFNHLISKNNIKNGKVIKKLKDNDNAPVLSIEKISTNLGEYLITQEFNRNEIKLWFI